MPTRLIFFTVQEALLATGDIAAIYAGHAAVLVNDPTISTDQTVGSERADFPFCAFLTDPCDLKIGAMDDFSLAGVGQGKGLSLGAGAAKAQKNQGSHGKDGEWDAGHGDLLSMRLDAMSVSVGCVPFRYEEKAMAALNRG